MVKTLVEYLKNNDFRGRNQARLGSAICKDLNIKDTQQLREMVNRARVQGHAICSCADGYYYAATDDEIEQCCRSLEYRAKSILGAASGMRFGMVLREARQ